MPYSDIMASISTSRRTSGTFEYPETAPSSRVNLINVPIEPPIPAASVQLHYVTRPSAEGEWSEQGSDDGASLSALEREARAIREKRFSRPTLPPSEESETPSQQWKREEGFWRSFISICIPLLLSALEGSVTNTALPTISEALNLGTKFSWVATAFLLASTIFQPLYGQLGDMWGRKYPMMIAVVVFAIGSVVCGCAKSGAMLIAGRVVQGLGTGGIDLFAEMILCDIIPLRKRGPYLAIKNAIFAIGTTIGPLLGGYLAEKGWRWCFWINIPVCVIALVIMFFYLNVGGGINTRDYSAREELKKIDVWGTTVLTFSVVMILVSLSTADAPHPWSHPAILTPLILGFVGLITFACFQRSKRCKYPIMPPHVFSNRTTNIAFALTAIHGFITYGFQFFLPLFFQAVKGSNPTKSGLEVLPTTLVIVVLAAAGGPLLSYWGKYKPIHIIGFGLMTFGLGLSTLFDKDTAIGAWLVFQIIVASGSGIVISSMLPSVQVKLPDDATAQSAGSWAFLRGTGSLFGVAIPSAIFNLRFRDFLPNVASEAARSQLSHGQAYQHGSSSFITSFDENVQSQIVVGFTESLKSVWITFAVAAGTGFLLTWGEKTHKMRKDLNTKFGLKTQKINPMMSETEPGTPDLEKSEGYVEFAAGPRIRQE